MSHRRLRFLSKTVGVTTIQSGADAVTDVSVIPYMRHQHINFQAVGLKPNRRVWFFFDDIDVTDYIIKPDELTLNSNAENAIIQTVLSANNGTIITTTGGSNGVATVVSASKFFDFDNATSSTRDDPSWKKLKRIFKLVRRSGTFASNQDFLTSITANTGIVGAIKVQGNETLDGFFQSAGSNTITLPISTKNVPNNYWGIDGSNTIILMGKNKRRLPGETKKPAVLAYIGDGVNGFDNVSRTLYLANTRAELYPDGDHDDEYSWTIGDAHYTDGDGKISGTFFVPAGTFRTGDRVFKIIDISSGDENDASTYATYTFSSAGLEVEKSAVVSPIVSVVTAVRPRPRRRGGFFGPEGGNGGNKGDPLAQTFFVDGAVYPDGIFLSSVDLYFRSKDPILPVVVQIRPTVNGYPSSEDIVPYGESFIDSDYVVTSEPLSDTQIILNGVTTTKTGDLPDFEPYPTNVKFKVPVYLPPGEYALVVLSDSLLYEVYVSELGEKILGSERKVSEQPYLGSFFKSQNASTWDAIQLEDLCFRLHKCVFETSGQAILTSLNPTSNVSADMMVARLETFVPANTSIVYAHSYPGVGYLAHSIDDEEIPSSRVDFTDGGTKYNLRATITTGSTDISPILFTNSGLLLAIENYIDNANVSQSNFVIVNAGSGYDANAHINLTISGSEGSGASAYATCNSAGFISSVTLTAGGSGYLDNVRVSAANSSTVGANNQIITANGTGGVIRVSSELDPSGGTATAKYISRVVTLAEGFDAGDLRVFITAYKPLGTDVRVYYKVKSSRDPDSFEEKPYTQMTQVQSSALYSGKDGFYDTSIEYEFTPDDTDLGIKYASDDTTYTSFNQYAIKIVMTSDNSTYHPIIYDMRAIALAAP